MGISSDKEESLVMLIIKNDTVEAQPLSWDRSNRSLVIHQEQENSRFRMP